MCPHQQLVAEIRVLSSHLQHITHMRGQGDQSSVAFVTGPRWPGGFTYFMSPGAISLRDGLKERKQLLKPHSQEWGKLGFTPRPDYQDCFYPSLCCQTLRDDKS